VLCSVGFEDDSTGPRLEIVKYPTDTETHLRVLNVQCTIYPSDAAGERRQVSQVAAALRAVTRVVSDTPPADRCGARGTPVSTAELVETLRPTGITMHINQTKCRQPEADLPDATNAGPSGTLPAGASHFEEAQRQEGAVSCDVAAESDSTGDAAPGVTVDERGDATSMAVLNVECTIDPTGDDSMRQIDTLRQAMELLVRQGPG
jgi:hypothetical protein